MLLYTNSKYDDIGGPFQSCSFLVLMVCGYIFLLIERPWESISFLNGMPIERSYAVIMIFVALLNSKFFVAKSQTNKWVYSLLLLHFMLAPFAFSTDTAVNQGVEYAKMVVLYLLILAITENESVLKMLIKSYLFTMIFYTIHSMWEYTNGRVQYRMGISRMVGVGESFNDPNAFGASLVLSLPLAYVLARYETNVWLQRLYYIYFPLVVLCVVLTGSRSSFVALITVILLWTLLQKGKLKLKIIFFILFTLPIVWTVMPEEKQIRIRSIWDNEAGPANAHESADGRKHGWKASMQMFKQNPVTGVGAGGGNFVGYRIMNHIDADVGQPESPLQAHILYGEVLAEHGIVGGFLFVGLVLSIINNCVKSIKSLANNNFLKSFAGAILICLFLLLLFGFAGHNFYRPMWLWLAAWSGCVFTIVNNSRLHPQC